MRNVFLYLLLVSSTIFANQCDDWFKNSGIKPGPDCVRMCSILPVNLGTFSCPGECERLCGKSENIDPKLKSKIKEGRPKDWHPRIEKAKKWASGELEKMLKALKSLPEKLHNYVKGYYRLDSSVVGDNPGREDKGNVVVYDSAFSEKYSLPRVVTHESAHAWYEGMSEKERQGYLNASAWRKSEARGLLVPGRAKESYLDPRAMRSPDEDFALNTEHYLYDPERLKKASPRVYDWFEKELQRMVAPK